MNNYSIGSHGPGGNPHFEGNSNNMYVKQNQPEPLKKLLYWFLTTIIQLEFLLPQFRTIHRFPIFLEPPLYLETVLILIPNIRTFVKAINNLQFPKLNQLNIITLKYIITIQTKLLCLYNKARASHKRILSSRSNTLIQLQFMFLLPLLLLPFPLIISNSRFLMQIPILSFLQPLNQPM